MIEREKIYDLVDQELKEANKKYPLFHSPHEAYAVLKEEVDELKFEVDIIEDWGMSSIWHDVTKDRNIEETARIIYDKAIFVVQEAIQIAAMCEKIKQSKLYEDKV